MLKFISSISRFKWHYHIWLIKKRVIMGWIKTAEMLYCGYYYIFRDYLIMLTLDHIMLTIKAVISQKSPDN